MGDSDGGMLSMPDPFGIWPETGENGDTDAISAIMDPGDLLGRSGNRARQRALEDQRRAQEYWLKLSQVVPHQQGAAGAAGGAAAGQPLMQPVRDPRGTSRGPMGNGFMGR
jgi:hypothetical protein